MAEYNLFDSAPFGQATASYGTPYTNGTEFYVTAQGWVTQIRYAHHTAAVGNLTPRTAAIYSTTNGTSGTMVAGPFTMPTPVRGQWCVFDLPEPLELTPNTRYRAAILYPAVGGNSSWLSTPGFFTTGAGSTTMTNGILVRPNQASALGSAQGQWAEGTAVTFPRWAEGGEATYTDVTVTDVDPSQVGPDPEPPFSVAFADGSVTPATIEGVAMPDGTLRPIASTNISTP